MLASQLFQLVLQFWTYLLIVPNIGLQLAKKTRRKTLSTVLGELQLLWLGHMLI